MKNTFLFASTFLLFACSDSPSVEYIEGNNRILSTIEKAAQSYNAYSSIPIILNVGYLVNKELLSKNEANEIRELTHCSNLYGIEFIFAEGKIQQIDVVESTCTESN